MRILADKGVAARVVSMPCTQVLDAQPIEYREGVLPDWCRKRIAAIEAGHHRFLAQVRWPRW